MFRLNRNERSHWSGNGVHVESELVFMIGRNMHRARLMAITPVDEVWGIGRRLGAKLVAQGINTVADLVASDAKGLRAQYGVVVERIVQELRGLPCAELTVEPAAEAGTRTQGRIIAGAEAAGGAVAHQW